MQKYQHLTMAKKVMCVLPLHVLHYVPSRLNSCQRSELKDDINKDCLALFQT